MLHLRLAAIAGCVDVDSVVNKLTSDQLLEWWAFGCLNGWFVNPDETKQQAMNAKESMQFFQGLSHARNDNP